MVTCVGKRETRGPYAKTRRRVPAVSGIRHLKLLSRLRMIFMILNLLHHDIDCCTHPRSIDPHPPTYLTIVI